MKKPDKKYIASLCGVTLGILLGVLSFIKGLSTDFRFISPLNSSLDKGAKEVFGFAPYWTIDNLENVDYNTLTTLAYFGIPVLADGNLDYDDYGYEVFKSQKATEVFRKAHAYGTRVVLTLTQMENHLIESLMDDESAQNKTINQSIRLVKKRGIDGINVDFEYVGNPGHVYRAKFTAFVKKLTEKMHKEVPNSRVTVSVYASSIKEPKIYEISPLAKVSDGIFMMAYDYANATAEAAMPTSPLRGHKEGKYWYDVSTAVEDFLEHMPANKLILGVPWYGYNYVVTEPEEKAETSWYFSGVPQTYSVAKKHIRPNREDIADFKTGWDKEGAVGWKAYYSTETGAWRMIFIEDVKSLALKYDFSKQHNLGGIGIWALGFDDGQDEMWRLLADKFGLKVADHSIFGRKINESI